ncbi:hypothetical protein ABW20_dc0103045 [Dactylellina cionopaga]|nr:hypothetical protein ABW20_dc0103045 [Dactylellina cionopaga]
MAGDNEPPTAASSSVPIDREKARAIWYSLAEKLSPSPYTQELFEKYSGVPPDEVVDHIVRMREKAHKIYPYPCIAAFRFIDFAVVNSPIYDSVLETLKAGGKYLDLGCCFAQDIRALAYAGVPSENLYGADLQPGFIDLGYELFNDKEKLKSTFFKGDIFDLSSFEPIAGDTSDPALFHKLTGQIDILSARSFLHLFSPEQEFKAACQMAEILRKSEGSIIMGTQLGSRKPGPHTILKRHLFRHDPNTWKDLWERVGKATDTQWDIQAKMFDLSPEFKGAALFIPEADREDMTRLEFVIKRL